MMTIKELLPSMDNFIQAVVHTRAIDEQEFYRAIADMCNAQANRLAGLDPDRNR